MNMNMKLLAIFCLAMLLPSVMALDRKIDVPSGKKWVYLEEGQITADHFYQDLIEFEQDIDHAILTYLFCNPLNTNLNARNIFDSSYVDLFGREVGNGMKSQFMINGSVTEEVPSYGWVMTEVTKWRMVDGKNVSEDVEVPRWRQNGTENVTYEKWIPLTNSLLRGRECYKIRQEVNGKIMYDPMEMTDIVPKLDLTKENVRNSEDVSRLTEKGRVNNEFEQKRWIWWDILWNNRMEINITNSYPQTLDNYETKIVIPKQTGMQDDYGDLRFTTNESNATALNYWIEDYNTTEALVWVNMSLDSGVNTIYVYYDNDAVETTGNPYKTFALFDHFELPADSVNTTIWNQSVYGTFNPPVINNSIAFMLDNYPTFGDSLLTTSNEWFGTNTSVDLRIKLNDTDGNFFMRYGYGTKEFNPTFRQIAVNYYRNGTGKGRQTGFMYNGTDNYHTYMLTPASGGYIVASNYSIMSVARRDSDVIFSINYEENASFSTGVDMNLQAFARVYGSLYSIVDWMRVRQEVATPPSVAFGQPEVQPTPPAPARTNLEVIEDSTKTIIWLMILMIPATGIMGVYLNRDTITPKDIMYVGGAIAMFVTVSVLVASIL